MDELRLLTKDERECAYNEVFREAFPASELKPLARMEELTAAGEYDFWGLFRDGVPVGYVTNWLDGRFVLIDYLCVPKQIRSGGIGSKLLTEMMERYPADTVFIGETEAETGEAARDELILRRQGLYRRLGAQYMPYDCALFGVKYCAIVWAKQPVRPEEVLHRHDGFYRKSFSEQVYRATIQIPLHPGEAVLPPAPWVEQAIEKEAGKEK